MSAFNGATLMITGGTGSFGNTVLKHFLSSDIGQIRIFSRDEKKQDDMMRELQAKCRVVSSFRGRPSRRTSLKSYMGGRFSHLTMTRHGLLYYVFR